MARGTGARSQLAAAFETVYGTPPASGFFQMPFANDNVGSEQPLLDNELLGFGRDPLAPVKDAITVGGDITVPIDAESWGVWLKGAFGDPTTTGAGPFDHEFQSGGVLLPSLALELGIPEVPHYAMSAGCAVDQISWQMQRTGNVTATVSLIGQGETKAATSQAGTLSAFALKRFGSFNGSISRAGSALGNVVSAQITYANNLDPVETIRNDGKIEGVDPGIAALTGNVVVRFANQTLLDQAINGTDTEFQFDYLLGSGENFNLTAHSVFLPKPKIEVTGPGGIEATFDWQAALDSVTGRMCTATLTNDVSGY
ncbi:hypothetical protein DDZ14_08515 [Maritimibacter sp. 55A14]|uniref:phage tail tube protein n=1 Tax=Maritimibacter sp. 55A14 TaxID=2174844 RepID=UPI000D615783|nr:phage tail tube protein [Maritimibacter sp. 55A14]PWE32779.1 hypothetical protein DDZ14_08515 [Maritimibacter sp. 55A14]